MEQRNTFDSSQKIEKIGLLAIIVVFKGNNSIVVWVAAVVHLVIML